MEKVDWKKAFPNNKKVDIAFCRKDTKKVLNLVGNSLNDEKEVVDKQGNTEKSFTNENSTFSDDDPIKSKQLGAIMTGSKIFLRNNLGSLYDYLETFQK